VLVPRSLVPQVSPQITEELSNLLVKVVAEDGWLLKHQSDTVNEEERHTRLGASSTVNQFVLDSVFKQKHRNKCFARTYINWSANPFTTSRKRRSYQYQEQRSYFELLLFRTTRSGIHGGQEPHLRLASPVIAPWKAQHLQWFEAVPLDGLSHLVHAE
jgi:hypothetical protein